MLAPSLRAVEQLLAPCFAQRCPIPGGQRRVTLSFVTWQAYATCTCIGAALVAMAAFQVRASLALAAALTALVLGGILSPRDALSGFSNEAVATIGLLLAVAVPIERSGALRAVGMAIIGRGISPRWQLVRLTFPVAAVSGFFNNTPIVAMLMGEIRDAARKRGLAPSLFLIPLSYAALLGGMCTLIGTSTNLTVNAVLRERGMTELSMFGQTPLALPVAFAGLLVVIALAPFLLPDRRSGDAVFDAPSRFTSELIVDPSGPLVGQPLSAIAINGRNLTPLEIRRGDTVISAPEPAETLGPGDLLLVTTSLVDIAEFDQVLGLTIASSHPGAGPQRRRLREAIVTARCPLVGHRVGEGSFRARYGGAVIAIEREGRALEPGPQSTWKLRAGDRLLVDAGPDFDKLIDTHDDVVVLGRASAPTSRVQRALSLGVLAALVIFVATGTLDIFVAGLAGTVAIVALRLVSLSTLAAEIDWELLATIAISLALGRALEATGAARVIAEHLASLGGDSLRGQLLALFLATAVLTELISNNAAAVIMLPIALSLAGGASMPHILTVAIAASASFMIPIGYQTHMLVYGIGGYRFFDFVRLGLPLSLCTCAMTVWLAPLLA